MGGAAAAPSPDQRFFPGGVPGRSDSGEKTGGGCPPCDVEGRRASRPPRLGRQGSGGQHVARSPSGGARAAPRSGAGGAPRGSRAWWGIHPARQRSGLSARRSSRVVQFCTAHREELGVHNRRGAPSGPRPRPAGSRRWRAPRPRAPPARPRPARPPLPADQRLDVPEGEIGRERDVVEVLLDTPAGHGVRAAREDVGPPRAQGLEGLEDFLEAAELRLDIDGDRGHGAEVTLRASPGALSSSVRARDSQSLGRGSVYRAHSPRIPSCGFSSGCGAPHSARGGRDLRPHGPQHLAALPGPSDASP